MSERPTTNDPQHAAAFAALMLWPAAGPQNLVLNRRAPLLYFLEHDHDKGMSQVYFADLTEALSSEAAPAATEEGTIAWAKMPFDESCATVQREQTKEELLLQERQRVFGEGVTAFDYFEE